MPPLVFVLAFHNELEYRHQDEHINSCYDAVTPCENLVNFSLITPDITLLICVPIYIWLRGKISLPIFIHRTDIAKHSGLLECRWAC